MIAGGSMVRASVYRDVGVYRDAEFRNTSDMEMWRRIARKYPIGVLELVVGYFCSILPLLDGIWPAGTLWLNRRLVDARAGKPDWLAAGFILKACKTVSRRDSQSNSAVR